MRIAEPRHAMSALMIMLVLLGLPRAAFAAEHGFQWGIQGWYILDFLLIAVPLIWWIASKMRAFLKSRRDLAGRELETAQSNCDLARGYIADVDARLATLATQVEHLMSEFHGLGVDEQEAIRKDTIRQIERMHQDARFRIEQEGKMAREILTRTLVVRALAKAEEQIAATGGGALSEDVVDAFVSEVANKEGVWRTPA